jgi:hypothetical protein
MTDQSHGKNERSQLAEHLDALQAVLGTTTDLAHRAALEKLIIYLGNRLADIVETRER